jgi:hypothetical protein
MKAKIEDVSKADLRKEEERRTCTKTKKRCCRKLHNGEPHNSYS